MQAYSTINFRGKTINHHSKVLLQEHDEWTLMNVGSDGLVAGDWVSVSPTSTKLPLVGPWTKIVLSALLK